MRVLGLSNTSHITFNKHDLYGIFQALISNIFRGQGFARYQPGELEIFKVRAP